MHRYDWPPDEVWERWSDEKRCQWLTEQRNLHMVRNQDTPFEDNEQLYREIMDKRLNRSDAFVDVDEYR